VSGQSRTEFWRDLETENGFGKLWGVDVPVELKEALLYDKLSDDGTRCNVCQRRCEIHPDGAGYCHTRTNRRGKLYSLVYSKVSSCLISPIEKKPLFHFHPGSLWLSLGTWGCNFRCPGCQNWTIAHARIDSDPQELETITPEESVALAQRKSCKGISWTYNEPTVWFEYTLQGAKLAKASGLLTHYVTNGFITAEALDMIGPYTKRARHRWGMWVEIITNVTPGYNDDEPQLKDVAAWIRSDLGEFTPWHLTGFVPHLELSHIPATPVPTLEKAREIGLGVGLRYVYLGNAWGHPAENTHCHNCRKMLVERNGFSVSRYEIKEGKCPYCHAIIPGRFDQTGGNEKQSWTNPAAGLD
jgi:pyruvate formate lyase activating enzyme